MKKRIVSTLMALCMVLTLLPVQVLAAGGAAPQHQLDNTTIGQYTTLGNGVYTLTEDVSISSTLKITGEATLDLNGYMLRMTGSASVLTVESGGHLTIADSRPDAEERRFAPDGDGLWVLDATGEKSVTGGIITGGTGTLGQWYFYGGGVYVNSGGHLTMEGGSIVGCSAYGANGIYGDGGGVFLKSNYGESIDRTTFTMNGGSIIGCTAGSLGGGVVVARSTFTMNKGSILSCTAKESGGGGVDVQNGGSFTMKDGVISDCVSRGGETWKFGGGVYVENGSFTMDGGRITACRAANTSDPKYGRGGGVALSGQGVFELNAGTIDASCTATGAGGAVYSTGGTLCANGGTIAGGVMNSYGTITGSGGTRFSGSVTNDEGGSIKSGTFEETSDVLNYGTITGGTFEGDVTCEGRLLGGGSGGSLVGGTVSGGSFKNPIQVIYGTIIGPEYKWTEKEPSYGGQYRLTYQVDGKAYAWQWLGEGFFPVMPQGPDKEGHTFLTWVYGDGEDKDKMVNEGDPLTTDRTAVARYAVGGGTEQEPCRIGSKEELEFFAVQVDRFGSTGLCAVLTNDIVVNSGTFDEAGRYTPAAGETVSGMNPIGSETQPYTGTFNGGGYTIRGVYRDNREALNSLYSDAVYPAGLFGWLKGATVKNLTVTGYVGGRACVGGIAGHADAGTTILNCRNECIVVSVDRFSGEYGPAQYAGGIVGYNEGKVTACCNTGTVTGADSVGGIAGGPAGTVSDCYNVGAVTGDSHVGGIAGGPAGTVSYCYNVGTVTGGVEIANDATVSKCFFLGTQGMSAEKFANGTVLAALIDGRADGAHPWDTECVGKRLSDGGMRLPVLAWQKLSAAHEGGTATCTEKAVCTLCGQAYGTVDANNHVGGTELRNAKKATCTEDGHTGDTYCKGCGVKLQSGTAIKATGHTGGTATCVSAAVCTVCKQAYGKKDAGNHDLKHTAAKAPGIYARGNTEYWQCKACGKYFADANGTKTISQSDTVIPPRGRTAESGSENGKSSPGTFDAGIGVYGVTAVTSLTGLALLRRKRRDEE